ncbi:hypothetical protein VTN77DRAFT_9556 [Rasamsonia byssochlamydoides]|uniref:uncharacterized protein n=1 Tax=Rasamsonia byssochlamydoides TaxID=89139 RepID=UPI00374240B7
MASTNDREEELPLVRLPEPYKTTYELEMAARENTCRIFRLRLAKHQDDGLPPPEPLHHPSLVFSELAQPDPSSVPPDGNNSPWARATRAPVSYLTWDGTNTPTVAQMWNVIYAILSLRPDPEIFRFVLSGEGKEQLAEELKAVGLAIKHPEPSAPPGQPIPESRDHVDQLVILRGAFWQGAGSPFGSRAPWVADPGLHSGLRRPLSAFPLYPLEYTLTTKFPDVRVHAHHPVRPPKPAPGSRIYSRYIPHLKEFFSMVALDYTNDEHLLLFHKWQNDPRVAQGWNQTGTLEEHREYLRKMHEDPHQLAVLAKFDDTYFAYFEIYWAKEDHLGAYYDAGDYDRGRHSLVGDARFRGPHRVMAWWSSLMHYIFLDDPRTSYVVGEPKATNATVLAYDHAHGFNVEKLVDLPHKRSAFVRCSREKFFQISPFGFNGGGTVKGNPDRALKL